MFGAVLDVLTTPDRFFAERLEDPPLKPAAVVVFLTGMIAAVESVQSTLLMAGLVPEEARGFVVLSGLIGAGFALVFVFVYWGLWTAVFYGVSALLGGEGDIRTLLIFTGWGFLPQLFSGIVSAIATYVVLGSASPPPSPDPQAIQAFTQEIQTAPLNRTAAVVGIVMTLWSGYVWTYGVHYARDLDTRRAAITAAIAVVLSSVFPLLNLAGVQLF